MPGGVALVQGASRGVGLQSCRHILNNHADALVIASCRNPSSSTSGGLLDLQRQFGGEDGRLKIRPLDVADEKSVYQFGASQFCK